MSYVQPYATQADLPSASETVITESRKVDITTGRYVMDANGNPEGDSEVAHLVKMAVLNIPANKQGIITPRYAMAYRQSIRAALKPLVDAQEIKIDYIRASNPQAGALLHEVKATDLTTGKPITLKVKHS